MQWEDSVWLFALWVVPVLAALLVYSHRRRIATARRFVDPTMFERLMPELRGWRPWIKGGLWLAGVTLLIVGMARPRFGVYFEKVAARGVDLFVLLDVSRSMLAEDLAPNRLERAKFDVRDLLTKLAGDRVGLIAFAGAAVVQVPLTTDQGFFLTALNDIDTASAPRGGSLIGDAIRKAIASMEPRNDRDQVIVLITDGEDHDSFPAEAAQQAAERHIKFITVGMGDSTDGMRIPLRDESGELSYLKHDGQEVWSRMDERLLKEIAHATGGAYIPAKTRAYDLGQIYEEHLAGLQRGEIRSEKRKRFAEQFQLFAFLGLGLLIVEMLVPRYPRKDSKPDRATLPEQAVSKTPTAASLALKVSLLLLFSWNPSSALAASKTASRHVLSGIRHFQNGDYTSAEKAFAEADVALPEDPRIAFDQACTFAAQNDVDKAVEHFQTASQSRDEQVVASAHYNLGCLAAAKGRAAFGETPEDAPPEARQAGLSELFQAIGHYRDCLRLDEDHSGARHNLEILRVWIKRMQDLWSQRDREKQREEMDLLQFLEMIQAQQQTLRRTSRALQQEEDSPRRRQAIAQSESEQRTLAEEIPPLQEKLRQSLQTPPGQQGPPGPTSAPPSDNETAVEQLAGVGGRAGSHMTEAADYLAVGEMDEVIDAQASALELLNDIYMVIAPFTNLLSKATSVQQTLLDQSSSVVAPADEDVAQPGDSPDVDFSELARNQTFVSRWSQVFPFKAEQELKQLENQPAGPPLPPSDANANTDQAAENQEGLKTALEKAIATGPKIEELSTAAVESLESSHAKAALPNQEEALKLLKEIAETLPQQEQNQENNQNQDPGDQNQEDKQQEQQQNQSNDDSQQQRSQQEVSRQQAEAIMRKVRERERDYRKRQKQLQGYAPAAKVDKDW